MAEPAAALHAVFGADIGPLEKKLAEASKIAEEKARSMVSSFERAGKDSARVGNTVTSSFAKSTDGVVRLGNELKGTGAALSGVSGAMQLLGTQGSPAIAKLGNAVAALTMGGFTPLGLAIGAVTAGIGAFVGSQSAAEKSAESLNKTLEDQRKRFNDLVDSAERAEFARSRGGISGSSLDIEQRISDRQSTFDQAEITLSQARADGAPAWVARAEAALAAARAQLNTVLMERDLIDRRLRAEEGPRGESPEMAARRSAEVLAIFAAMRAEAKGAAAATAEMAASLEEISSGAMGESPWWPEGQIGEAQAAAVRTAREAHEAYLGELGQLMAGQQAQSDMQAAYEEMMSGVTGESARVVGERVATETQDAIATSRQDQIRDGGFSEGFGLQMETIRENLATVGELGAATATNLSGNFASAFADFATGTKSASEAMKAFAMGFIQDTVRMIAAQLALRAVTTAFGAPTTPAVPGFATGGTFTVGGYGGTDSQLVAFRASPGERVDVTPPGKSGGGSKVTVNVHNNAGGTATRVAHREVAGGQSIDVFIERVVERSMESGGTLDRVLQARGLGRRGRQG